MIVRENQKFQAGNQTVRVQECWAKEPGYFIFWRKENAFSKFLFWRQYIALDGKEKGREEREREKEVSLEGNTVFRLSPQFHRPSPPINTEELLAYFSYLLTLFTTIPWFPCSSKVLRILSEIILFQSGKAEGLKISSGGPETPKRKTNPPQKHKQTKRKPLQGLRDHLVQLLIMHAFIHKYYLFYAPTMCWVPGKE